MDIKLGKYQHFKGKHYQVIGLAINSETLEELVVYQALYPSTEFGDQAIWVRPKKMFADFVEVNNELIPRFKFIK